MTDRQRKVRQMGCGVNVKTKNCIVSLKINGAVMKTGHTENQMYVNRVGLSTRKYR